ncbi:MAG: Rnf-Nqr domain containing protein [bacterium]
MIQNQRENGFLIILGVMPIIALTDTALNALGIGIVTLIVLFLSGIVFLLFAKFLNEPSRTFVLIIITGTITTIIKQVLSYHLPELCNNLDVFISLIAINSFVLYSLRYNNTQNSGLRFVLAAAKKWLGVVCIVFVIGILREILGQGTLVNKPILSPDMASKALLFINAPAGAFLMTALVLLGFELVKKKTDGK